MITKEKLFEFYDAIEGDRMLNERDRSLLLVAAVAGLGYRDLCELTVQDFYALSVDRSTWGDYNPLVITCRYIEKYDRSLDAPLWPSLGNKWNYESGHLSIPGIRKILYGLAPGVKVTKVRL